MERTRRTERIRKDTDTSGEGATQCHLCTDPDPHVRSAHQMQMARAGIDALRTHLYRFFALTADTDRRHDLITDICRWMATLIDTYDGYVDPETGAPLPWWEARQQAMALSSGDPIPF